MVFHARFAFSFKASQLGFLVSGQNLHHFSLDAGVLNFQFDLRLRIGCRQGASLSFIKRATLFEGAHRGVIRMHLLHQGLECGLLFLPDRLDLILLRAAKVEIVREKAHHLTEVAVRATMSVGTLRGCHRDRKHESGADGENTSTSRFHWNSLAKSYRLPNVGGVRVHPNVYRDKNTICENKR